MTPDLLKQYLAAMREANVMSAKLVLPGEAELAVTFGLDMPADPAMAAPVPGGWKQSVPEGVSDPEDPDPLGLGTLDAPMLFDEVPETEEVPE